MGASTKVAENSPTTSRRHRLFGRWFRWGGHGPDVEWSPKALDVYLLSHPSG